MMGKRGQVALYAIIAVMIVSAAGFLAYAQREAIGIKFAPPINPEISSVKTFVESCLKGTGEQALFIIGKQGGYYLPPENSAGSVAVYFYEGQQFFPEKNAIEGQLAMYVDDNIADCINNFSKFPDFEITSGSMKTTAYILQDKVRFDLNWPLTVKKSTTYEVTDFSAEIDSRLSVIYVIARNIIQEQMQDPRLCLSCMIDMAARNDLQINMENKQYDAVTFTIQDSKVPLFKGMPYEFSFVNKYKNE